jgi:hypothetical protein
MPGFDNSVMYADNVDFSGGSPVTGEVTLDGQLLIGSTAAPHIRVATIAAGPGATVTNGPGAITIGLAGPMGYTWSVITSAGNVNPMLAFNGYITGGAVLTTLLLPAAANIGDTFIVTGLSSLFQVKQNAGQSILLGSQTSTIGAGGSLSSTMVSDSLIIVCVTANTVFKVISSMGNLTVI